MDKRSEYLQTLGLGPDATWDEVTLTYKDLMRVWHPDRFPSDERLRKKAEQESQRINHAMTELKKLGKEPPSKAKPRPEQRHQQNTASRPTTEQRTTGTSNESHPRGSENLSQSSFTHSIPPLTIRQKPFTSIIRAVCAIIVLYVAVGAIHEQPRIPFQAAFVASIAFAALDLGIRNILSFFILKPVVAVDRAGFLSLQTGRLGWLDFDRVWPALRGRSYCLCIAYSPDYLRKHSIVSRIWFYLRTCLGLSHVTIPFSGLTSDPMQVLHMMKLQRMHDCIILENQPPPRTAAMYIAHLTCIASAGIVILRCLAHPPLSALDYAPYLAIFAVAKCFEISAKMLRTEVV